MSKDKSCSHNKESLESDSTEMINTVMASIGKQLNTNYFSSPETSHQRTKDKENK